jgi:hypothetical protein
LLNEKRALRYALRNSVFLIVARSCCANPKHTNTNTHASNAPSSQHSHKHTCCQLPLYASPTSTTPYNRCPHAILPRITPALRVPAPPSNPNAPPSSTAMRIGDVQPGLRCGSVAVMPTSRTRDPSARAPRSSVHHSTTHAPHSSQQLAAAPSAASAAPLSPHAITHPRPPNTRGGGSKARPPYRSVNGLLIRLARVAKLLLGPGLLEEAIGALGHLGLGLHPSQHTLKSSTAPTTVYNPYYHTLHPSPTSPVFSRYS